jgi:transposase-like protein
MERVVKDGGGQEFLTLDAASRKQQIRDLLRERMKASTWKLIAAIFEEEVQELCGPRYTREHPDSCRRGGSDGHGVIRFGGQRTRVTRPRVRRGSQEQALASYEALGSYDMLGDAVLARMIRGVSTRDYEATVEELAGSLGLAKSSVSRAFVQASQKDLEQINGRDLSKELFVALFFDGVDFAGIGLIVGMGITEKGQKVILGLVEGHTENTDLCLQLIENLKSRGLTLAGRFLAVLDGAKALQSAVKKSWGERVEIQRCQVHKLRNVLSHLPRSRQSEVRRRMSVAYHLEDAVEAEKELRGTVSWLRQVSDAAASSLEEGLEETLTVVKLKLPPVLRRTLATTNPIESVFDAVRHRSRNVKRWRSRGRHASRWAASSLLFAEKRLKKIKGYRSITVLQTALTNLKSVDTASKVG